MDEKGLENGISSIEQNKPRKNWHANLEQSCDVDSSHYVHLGTCAVNQGD